MEKEQWEPIILPLFGMIGMKVLVIVILVFRVYLGFYFSGFRKGGFIKRIDVALLFAFLVVRFTVPTSDNLGSCLSPILVPNATDSLSAYIEVPSRGILDSLKVARGQMVTRTFIVPANVAGYLVRAYLSDFSGNVGCDTSATLKVSVPWKPKLEP